MKYETQANLCLMSEPQQNPNQRRISMIIQKCNFCGAEKESREMPAEWGQIEVAIYMVNIPEAMEDSQNPPSRKMEICPKCRANIIQGESLNSDGFSEIVEWALNMRVVKSIKKENIIIAPRNRDDPDFGEK